MPIFPFACEKCGFKEARSLSLEERNTELVCSDCGGKMKREISSFSVEGEGEGVRKKTDERFVEHIDDAKKVKDKVSEQIQNEWAELLKNKGL